ncbi:MAG TPA: hypothetical protein DHV36_02565 [Desulfobacteraceae bacterium]|nr:hypothetical protein [Desulfobacteraceae bacterium]|tara:strand:- start:277 stop:483 length:207 start_codon:yes stop_codon:yes gene_type:complete
MDKKKMAAAMAAVYMYIRTGEEAAAAAQANAEPVAPPKPPGPMGNVWGLSGRQAIMNASTMMQLRMFK